MIRLLVLGLWLSELPRDIAEKIAWRNGESLFGALADALKSK